MTTSRRKPRESKSERPARAGAVSNRGRGKTASEPGVMKVQKLKEGTVIDHLRSGTATQAYRALGLNTESGVVLIGMNLRSKKAGRKDIIKIEKRELTRDEINRIALLSPQANISIIRNFEVVEKFSVEVPNHIEGIIHCRNPNCISNVQAVRSRFSLYRGTPLTFRCYYCERMVSQGEMDFIV